MNLRSRKHRSLIAALICIVAGLAFGLCLALSSIVTGREDDALVASAQTNASTLGQWSAVQTWPVQATHVSLLPTGKVIFYPAWTAGNTPYTWDPATNNIIAAALPGYNIFCSGSAFLPDGRLLVTGGHIANDVGYAHASIYNPFSDAWTSLPDMNAGRWYPTTTALASGDALVVMGEENVVNGSVVYDPLPQVWQTSSNSWRDLTSAQLVIAQWYPYMFVAPNGKVFEAGPDQVTRYLDTTGTGAWTTVGNSNFGNQPQASAVMYGNGKVLLVGGADPPTAMAQVIDLTASTPAWRTVASMAEPRRQHNATLLPDGTVLVVGGSSGSGFDNSSYPVYSAELWNPTTEQWTTLASDTVYRGYHSTSLLLPDGRVLSAGGEIGGASAELFSPPYLFKGARPTIAAAPGAVSYGQTFSVQTPDAASITTVNWIRLGSVTHGFDEDQRINNLAFTTQSGSLSVTAPSDPNLAPPGYYMLFILNSSGVPSVAQIVQISGTLQSAPAAPSSLAAQAPPSAQVDLTWTSASTNQAGYTVERSTDGTTFSQIASVGSDTTTYADMTVAGGATYWYRVRAFNSAGSSAPSTAVKVTTPLPRFAFEDGTTQGWLAGGVSATGTANSTAFAHDGTHSLSLTLSNATASNWGSGYVAAPSSVVPNALLTGWAMVPSTGAAGLTAELYLQDANNTWFNAAGVVNLSPGTWNRLSFIVPSGVVTPVRWMGVWLTPASRVTWSGSVFVDGVDVYNSTSSSTPTPTPTTAPSATATPTATPTSTGAVPGAPTNLAAQAPPSAEVDLTWTAGSNTQTGYTVERSTDGATFSQIASVGSSTTAYADTTVAGSTTYWYRVRAFNSAGSSAPSNTVTVTTPLPQFAFEDGTTQGWLPGGVSATSTANSTAFAHDGTHSLSVTLANATASNWGSGYVAAPSTVGPNTVLTGWVMVPSTGASGLTAALFLQDANSTWYNAPTISLSPGTWNRLSFVVPSGVVTPARWVGVWLPPASGVTWSGSVFIDGVDVYNSSSSSTPTATPTTSIPATAAPTATPTAVPTATATPTPTQPAATATPTQTPTPAAPTNTPTSTPTPTPSLPAPSGLTATAVSGHQVNLAWTNNTSTATGIRIFRSTDGTNFAQLATAAATATTYSDTSVVPSTWYWYRLQAYSTTLTSAYSNTAKVRTGKT